MVLDGICKSDIIAGNWVSLLQFSGFLPELLLCARTDGHPFGMTDALHRPKMSISSYLPKDMWSTKQLFYRK